jgi:nucleoside-diphosphate-sugar epimerase
MNVSMSEVSTWFLNGVKLLDKDLERLKQVLSGQVITIIGGGSSLGRSLLHYVNALNERYRLNLLINVISRPETSREYIKSGLNANFHGYESAHSYASDFVFFCASPASPIEYLKSPIETVRVNTVLLLNAIDFMKPTTKFFYFSTTGVYGKIDRQILVPHEDSIPGTSNHLDIKEIYIQAKRAGEVICNASREQSKRDVIILRPSITYTPFVSELDNRLHSQVLKCLVQRVPFKIQSDGSDCRNFLFIADFISAVVKILVAEKSKHVYNITNPRELSVARYLSGVSSVDFNGYSLEIEHDTSSRASGARFSSTSVRNKYLSDMGWEPLWGLADAYKYISLLYKR